MTVMTVMSMLMMMNDDGNLIKVLKIILHSMKRHSAMPHLLLVMQGLLKVKVRVRIKIKGKVKIEKTSQGAKSAIVTKPLYYI